MHSVHNEYKLQLLILCLARYLPKFDKGQKLTGNFSGLGRFGVVSFVFTNLFWNLWDRNNCTPSLMWSYLKTIVRASIRADSFSKRTILRPKSSTVSFDQTHHIGADSKPLYPRTFRNVLSFHKPLDLAAVTSENGDAFHIRLNGQDAYLPKFKCTKIGLRYVISLINGFT